MKQTKATNRIWARMRWFFEDKKGRLVIGQRPNGLLLLWVMCFVLARIEDNSVVLGMLKIAGTSALLLWAWLEITAGDSPFRRVLGGVVLLGTVAGLIAGLLN